MLNSSTGYLQSLGESGASEVTEQVLIFVQGGREALVQCTMYLVRQTQKQPFHTDGEGKGGELVIWQARLLYSVSNEEADKHN